MKQRRFIQNALTMTVAMIIMRCVGTVFMIYISNRIGAEGIGLYQLVSSVYLLAVTLSTSGVSLAVTRIISEEIALNSPATARSAFRRCFVLSIFLGLIAGSLLFIFAKPLGNIILRDDRTILSLRLLSAGLPFLSAASVIRGYFLGLQKPIKSVSGDAVEQLAMMFVTVPVLTLFLPKGLEFACCGLVIGSVLSEAISCIYSIILYEFDKIKTCGIVKKRLNRRIFSISAPIAISNYFRSFLTTIENILVPPSLKRYGISTGQALSQYGMIKGMAMPLLILPAAIMSAFANLLIPEVSRFKALNANKRIEYIINRCFKMTFMFAFWVVGIFLCYSNEIGRTFYGNSKVGIMLMILTPLVPFMYLDQIVDSILKGLNQQYYTMKLNTIDSLIRVILIYVLVPLIGIRGYLIMFYVGTIFNASLSIRRLVIVSRVQFRFVEWVVKPVFASIFSCLFVWLLPQNVSIIIDILFVAAIYVLLLRIIGCITLKDVQWVKQVFAKK